MRLSRPLRLLLALASGLALAFSFPNYNMPLLAWGAVALLILASVGASVADAMMAGFLHGFFFYVSLTWIYVVIRDYGNVPGWQSAGILSLIGITGGFHMMIFTCGLAFVSRRRVGAAFVLAPLLWLTLEFIRTHLPIISFSWNLSGYAATGNLAFLQITSLTGIYGLSFLIGTFNALLAWVVYLGWISRAEESESSSRGEDAGLKPTATKAWQQAVIALGVFAVLLIVFGLVGPHFVPSQAPRYMAHLVQTNFPVSESYPANWLDQHAGEMDELEKISVDAAKRSPGLVVWPEVPAPFSFSEQKFAERAQRIARESANEFLVGVVDWTKTPDKQWQAANSATLLNPLGQRIFTYDKIHLVPFGEYVPLRQYLTFAGRLTADISDFTPGTTYSVGELPGGKFGVFICYEAIFPGEVRHFAANGAELLVNISNDGWFGRAAAPKQHLMMARVRAVESRRWLLRDTNNGYTVDIDPYGRTVASMEPDIRGQLDAPYEFRSDKSLYARWGDWIAWLSLLASIALMLRVGMTPRIDRGEAKVEVSAAGRRGSQRKK
jgi:apolipoprotein N-acyltransferase